MAEKATDTKTTTKTRIEPEVATGPVPTDFTLPPKSSGGGSKSKYPFDDLEVGQFFSVKNKDRRAMAAPVSTANKRHRAKAADGSDVQTREFYAADVDAETAKQLKGTAHEGAKTLLIRSK